MQSSSSPRPHNHKEGLLSPYEYSDISHGFYMAVPLESIAKGEQSKLKEIKREETIEK